MSTALKHLSSDGASLISGYDWGTVQAGAAVIARKFGLENTSDRVLGGAALLMALAAVAGNDGSDFFQCALDTATISRPFNLAASVGGSGGTWGGTGLVYYVLTATNAAGQTVASAEIAANVDTDTKKVTLTWDEVTGATGYKLYRSTTSGTYTTPALRTTISSGGTLTFVDDGSACGAGSPPSANTTGGAASAYGTPPSAGPGPLSFGVLAVGQQAFYWMYATVGAGASEIGNDRLCLRQFRES
jgi:hypothetical protein